MVFFLLFPPKGRSGVFGEVISVRAVAHMADMGVHCTTMAAMRESQSSPAQTCAYPRRAPWPTVSLGPTRAAGCILSPYAGLNKLDAQCRAERGSVHEILAKLCGHADWPMIVAGKLLRDGTPPPLVCPTLPPPTPRLLSTLFARLFVSLPNLPPQAKLSPQEK
ncbi:hypothetical protein GQ44DRAFT_763600 [Phaeosphaeriaceae sp. PMI808]|nr:hypothetical protein GQ44DRAFT_763600 [Phaeosphaeriaceae sp. PMI808]